MTVGEADSTWGEPVKGAAASPWRIAWETETNRLIVWSPLFLVAGIWTYFALDREPPGYMAWPLLVACVATLIWFSAPKSAKIIAIILLGFAAANIRTGWIGTPLLRAYSPAQDIIGTVADVDVRSPKRFTLIIELREAHGLPELERPERIQISVTGKHVPPRVGDTVRMTADLAPLPRPAQPGAFDYGRQLFFQSIGATGRSKTGVTILEEPPAWRFTLRRGFHDLRAAIGARVKAAIPGPLGSFADALITGERATIPKSMNDSLQASGLFHILSISGLHMALVAGGAFWALRALLALSPSLALRRPIKKWSAIFAIFVGLLYMLLADSGPATERSFIMIAIVFFAVLVDRPALSLHNLALAAIVILVSAPEQALAASFQMSFMAVMGLAAFLECWNQRTVEEMKQKSGRFTRWSKRLATLAVASVATSIVAGALSGIPAAHHFGRLAPYGVAANALALPIVSIVVMPSAMASVLLMPLGLEVIPLKFMGWGLEAVMLISDWVASWPGAGIRLPLLETTTAALLALTAAFALLPITRFRLLAIPIAALCIAQFFVGVPKPILLIDERAANAAILTEQGLVPALPKQGAASVSRWLSQYGDDSGFKQAALRKAWTCSATGCETTVQDQRVGFLLKSNQVFLKCPKVDVLISQEPLRRRCKGVKLTIDRFDVWRNGAYAIFADGTLNHVRAVQGQRPWVYDPRARVKK
jgi:competence protein ComEC